MQKKLFLFSIPLLFITIGYLFIQKDSDFNDHVSSEIKIIPSNAVEAYFTPDDDVKAKLLKLINSEKSEIMCALFRLTEKDIAAALIAAHKRRVKITLVVDKDGLAGSYNKVLYLFKEGIPVYVFPSFDNSDLLNKYELKMRKKKKVKVNSSALMHNKFFVFCDQKTILTGSYNFTKAAQEINQENVVIIRIPDIFNKYHKHFSKLCERSTKI